MIPISTQVYAQTQDAPQTPPAYMIYSGYGFQGTAACLRVYKEYAWFATAGHVIKGSTATVVIQGNRYPVKVMENFRTTGMIPDGLTILRTVNKIGDENLSIYLMDTDRQPKVGDKVWLVGYPAGRLQYKKTYVTELIKEQFLTRTYLSFGASGGLVIYDNGRLAGIIHGFVDGKGREGVHSNIALFASRINENYPFLIPRSQNNADRIALHDKNVKDDDVKDDDVKNDDHHHDKCDCECEGCKDCTKGECPCEPGCKCESDCPCRINSRSVPPLQGGPPLPPDQEEPIAEDPVDSTPLPPLQEPTEEPVVEEPVVEEPVKEEPVGLHEKEEEEDHAHEEEEEDHADIDEKLNKFVENELLSMKEEIIDIIKEMHEAENAVVPPVIPETEPETEPEIEPEIEPDPQPVIPGPDGPEQENVDVFGNLIDNAGWILPTLGVAIPGGALGWLGMQGVLSLFGRRRRRKEGGDDNIPPLFHRDVSEAEQIIGLRQSEQREPIFDTMRGILFEDEFNSNPNQSFKEAFTTVNSKFNQIAPVATQHTRVDTNK